MSPHANSATYDEPDLGSEYNMEEPEGLHGLVQVQGLVQVGATVTNATQLLNQAVAALRARTGWDDATARALISHSYTPAEGAKLKAFHASRAKLGLHGLVTLGKKADPFGAFFSQFDPTWPKAKFGMMIRSAIVAVAAPLGIPAGPLMDGIATMHQQFVGHPEAQHGPLPPMPAPHGLPPMAMRHHRKWSTGKKLLVAGAAVGGTYVVWKVFFARKKNPARRRRRKNASHRRRRR